MKKIYTLFSMLLCAATALNAQIIYDNGPLVNSPGQGVGGADVSNSHDGLVNYGFNQNFAGGFFVAEDFTVPSGETWNVDSIITFGYQTNSGNTSTFTEMYAYVIDNAPDAGGYSFIAGDSVTNILSVSDWSGIYRCGETTVSTSTARPIMRNVASIQFSLNAGNYWLVWAASGSLASGPWQPPISIAGVTVTGNSKQYYATNGAWSDVIDTAQAGPSDDAAQGLPFQFAGTIVTAIHNLNNNIEISFFPNPVTTTAQVIVNAENINFKNQSATFVVTDLLGKEVKRLNDITTKTFTFDKGSIAPGIYVYSLIQGDKNLCHNKFIIN